MGGSRIRKRKDTGADAARGLEKSAAVVVVMMVAVAAVVQEILAWSIVEVEGLFYAESGHEW